MESRSWYHHYNHWRFSSSILLASLSPIAIQTNPDQSTKKKNTKTNQSIKIILHFSRFHFRLKYHHVKPIQGHSLDSNLVAFFFDFIFSDFFSLSRFFHFGVLIQKKIPNPQHILLGMTVIWCSVCRIFSFFWNSDEPQPQSHFHLIYCKHFGLLNQNENAQHEEKRLNYKIKVTWQPSAIVK